MKTAAVSHLFRACAGILPAWLVCHNQKTRQASKNSVTMPATTTLLCFLGHVFFWLLWPSLVGAQETTLKRLERLTANEATLLGKARVLGQFNETARRFRLDQTGPRGRDYSLKMVWAPRRQRVLFCGANHGVPHRLNDVWEFDLATLSWHLLYAPDNPRDYLGLGKDFSDVEFRDGVLITQRGGPAVIGHTWWGLTWDPQSRLLLMMNTWVTDRKKAVEQLGGDPEQLYQGPPLWAFSPESGRWQMIKTSPPWPRPIFGGMLEYIPAWKGTLWHANNWKMQADWLYDGRENRWKDLKSNAPTDDFQEQSPAPEQVGYYDPGRRLVIVQRHRDTFHYDVQTHTWHKVLSGKKDSKDLPFGHNAFSPMYHDPISGHGLLIEFKTNTLWAYDPDNTTWTRLQPTGDKLLEGNKRLAYFDPARNVFVVIEGTNVWAYRYQQRSLPDAKD